MEASSSSAIITWDHDVFLSFRGDTRNSFVSHLYHALEEGNINVFKDNKLERGEEITPALLQTIERSRISLVIFSKDYASSPYCLDELVKIVECKDSGGQIVVPIFYNVDPTDVEEQRGSYEKAFAKYDVEFSQKVDKLKTQRGSSTEACSEHEVEFKVKLERWKAEFSQKLERWKLALAKMATFAGWHINTCHHDEAEYVKAIVKDVIKKLHSYNGGVAFPTSTMVGEAFRSNMAMILQCLSNANILRIGIHGMGGVGKTALMIHIHNSLLQKPKIFGHVYWVTISHEVSEEFSVHKLQDLIAKTIKVDFFGEDDEKKRAAKLSSELEKKGKCILILDDLWNRFSEEKVGLPIGVAKCQLILTSRSLKVCEQMDCRVKIKVGRLDDEESWNLFREEHGRPLCPEIVEIAKLIVEECGGLPLGIITMARSMRGAYEPYEWRTVLKELRESKSRKDDTEDEVFSILRLSYERLKDPVCQQCFLYCALYPEDYEIKRNDLIEYLIVEGIIEKMFTRREQHGMGHTLLNKLENVSLLEASSHDVFNAGPVKCVKMHDLVRDMALQILKSGGNGVMVGKAMEYWTEDLVRVSLTGVQLDENPLPSSPKCPNLLTLLFFMNDTSCS